MTTLQDRDQWPLAQQSPEEGRATQPLWPRRTIIRSLLVAPGGIAAFYAGLGPAHAADRLASIPAPAREKAMRRAMAVARGNPAYPFGAVITRIADGHLMAEGVNASKHNPMHHGEVLGGVLESETDRLFAAGHRG